METGNSSQVSDIYPQEDMEEMLLHDPDLRSLVDSSLPLQVDWSGVPVPDAGPAPSPTGELPATSVFPGLHFFDVQVDSSGNQKRTYVMATMLNKLFVNIGNIVPLKVKWDGGPGLFMRALMLFTQADSQKNSVKRCPTHIDKDSPINAHYFHREHVLACENGDTKYEFDPQSQRYSIVVPLSLQQGAESAQVLIKFMCKTSCPGGLNRAQTDVIFTLEDSERVVYGRQKISVKICSCPKRDKEREEELLDPSSKKKKKAPQPLCHQLPAAKKIKTENNESVTFLVTARNEQIAEGAKNLLKNFEASVRSVTHSVTAEPLLTISEDVAMFPPPYFQ